MAGEGQVLRAAREKKEWSYMETEETTKIRVRYIQALEEEEYGILPGTTYIKGYLRTYAKQLGLNPEEIMGLYNSSIFPEDKPVLESPPRLVKVRSLGVRPVILGSMAILVVVLVITIASLYQPGKKIASSPYSPPALPSAPITEAVKQVPSPQVVPNSENVAAATQDGLTAQLVFIQPCWIEVSVDGQSPFQGTFTAGTNKEVKGTSKIELLTLGNAGGLTVTLNGKTLPSLGKSGQVVHNVILTTDTLKSL
ncbi:Transcriptional regulator, XRE family [Candidatus Desulfosporosinus infrequens]|uniref:Transcriptional regulator, XRE family n=1 Tax=Candidatus Desulfosporosinus infrequens TaxID=2043169 RepID=A0A2U3LFP7_9FIRM|nr:Transcriptional regulator, XRE family [Candidatus Desulfosporosinus infrequens]